MNKKTIISILKWVISIGLIAWLYRRVEWNAFLGVIKETSPFFLLAGFGLIFREQCGLCIQVEIVSQGRFTGSKPTLFGKKLLDWFFCEHVPALEHWG